MIKYRSFFVPAVAAMALSAFSVSGSDFDRNFSSWEISSPGQVFRDTNCKVRGSSSIRIEKGGTAVLKVPLEADCEYELTFYVKGKGIQSGTYKQGKYTKPYGGRIQLHNSRSWMRVTSDAMKGKLETGTFDWRFGRRVVKSSVWKNSKFLNIELAVRGKGTIWFDEVNFRKISGTQKESFRHSYDNAISSLALVPQGVCGFFDPGETVKFTVHCESKSKKLEYAYKVKDENGKQILSVPRRALQREFTIPGQACGYYVVEADFFADGRKSRSLQSAFAVSRRIGKRDSFFRMGHGTHQKMYEAFQRIGVGSVCLKMSIPAAHETLEAQWKWHQHLYGRFLRENDFELTCTTVVPFRKKLRSPKELAEGWPLLNDRILKRFIPYIDMLLKETKGRAKQWQFQVELPTSASPKGPHEGTWSEAMSNFMIVTRMGARRVRKADPSIRILVGGNNIQKNTWTIEKLVLGDLVNEFDQYIIDAYTGQWDMTRGTTQIPEIGKMSFYEDASALAQSLGKGKIIGNAESGYAINYAAPFDRGLAIRQAQYTARQLIITKAAPVSFFELHTPCQVTGKELSDSSRSMTTVWKPVWFKGKLHQVPLPGGAMYATAASQLAFVKDPVYFNEGNNYCAVFRKSDGKTLLALWNIEKEFPFSFTFPAGTKMVTMYGREFSLPAGKNSLKLTTDPIYITTSIPVKTLAGKIRSELKKQSPKVLCAGYEIDRGSAKVFIRNISNHTVTGLLQGKKITVLPQQILSVNVKRSAAGGVSFRDQEGTLYPITLQKKHIIRVPFLKNNAVLDGSGKWLSQVRKHTLTVPGDIQPVHALQEELGYFKSSRNPNGHNVSADYRVAYDQENFYLAVEVDDPVHLQRYKGNEIWKDDCLQLVFDNREFPLREVASLAEKLNRPAYNFAVALTKQGPEFVNFMKKTVDSSSCKFNVTRKGKRTFYEICIPFKVFGRKPVSFGFVVFDNNYLTKKSAPYHLAFSGGVPSNQDASKMRKILYEASGKK